MHIEEILIVCHDKVCFGISTALIGQILRVPELTPLSLSPYAVRGVCAVGGNIMTAVDMNTVLGLEAVDTASAKSRVLSLQSPYSSSALIVSEVLVSTIVDPDRIEYISDPVDPIVAIYHYEEELIQILDVKRIIETVHPQHVEEHPINEKNENDGSVPEKHSNRERYLLFKMGGEMYALEIENLREILGAHYSLTALAGANAEIAGMMSLRDELLVVADLRSYCGFEPSKSDKNRILIVNTKGKTIGLIIDEIVDIKEYGDTQVDRFALSNQHERVSGVIHDPEYLVSLLGEQVIEEIVTRNDTIIITSDEAKETLKSSAAMEVVIFKLGEEEYALSIDEVAEIIDTTPVTPVAEAPGVVEGIINIRGQIVTIGSLHRWLGIRMSPDNEQKIIVCHTPKGRMGFFVDAVSDVMQVRFDEILDDVKEESIFSQVLHFDEGKRLVLLFNLEALYRAEGIR